MIIQQTIKDYLDTIEQKFGLAARAKTILKHRGGRMLFLKKHHLAQGQVVHLGDLRLMIRHLRRS